MATALISWESLRQNKSAIRWERLKADHLEMFQQLYQGSRNWTGINGGREMRQGIKYLQELSLLTPLYFLAMTEVSSAFLAS